MASALICKPVASSLRQRGTGSAIAASIRGNRKTNGHEIRKDARNGSGGLALALVNWGSTRSVQ